VRPGPAQATPTLHLEVLLFGWHRDGDGASTDTSALTVRHPAQETFGQRLGTIRATAQKPVLWPNTNAGQSKRLSELKRLSNRRLKRPVLEIDQ